jgi:prepilin-type N-terminal cleavage/methylation domain-containing protein
VKKNEVLNSERGFSLIELMIVVAILATLAFIGIPSYRYHQAKARASEAKSQLSALYVAETQFSAEWNGYHTDAMAIGFRPNGNLRYIIGFNAPSLYTIPGYTGPVLVPSNSNTGVLGLCPLLGCNNIAITPTGLTISAISIATSATMNAFTAAAEGFVGGSATDQWTINEGKVLNNVSPGGY